MDLSEQRPAQRYALVQGGRQLQAMLDERLPQAIRLESLRGVEGAAASVYFGALAAALPASLNFQGRNRRPPRDPFNAMLSLGYTLLHAEAVLMLYANGFDPFVGFYHTLSFGRESLASDIIEPLRAEVDAFLLKLFAEQVLRAEDFSLTDGGCLLGKAGRLRFYQQYDLLAKSLRKGFQRHIGTLGQALMGSAFEWPEQVPQPEREGGPLSDLL